MQGNTPLHRAAMYGRMAVADVLLEAGSDADTLNADGKSAAALAREMRWSELAEHLTERGP